MTKEQRLNIALLRLVSACRRLAAAADEFWPEYPYALTEALDELDAAREKLLEVQEEGPGEAGPILPPYQG